jgi:hypothetical protein
LIVTRRFSIGELGWREEERKKRKERIEEKKRKEEIKNKMRKR